MSKHEKRLAPLLAKPRDFTWREADGLLRYYGFDQVKRNSGSSHKTFRCMNPDVIFKLSEPHPGNELKRYQIESLIDMLKEAGFIE